MDARSNEKLNLDGHWSLTEAAFETIVRLMSAMGEPKQIVEYGSGPSTVRLAMAFPEAGITSIDSDKQSFESTKALIDEFVKQSRIILRYRRLGFERYGSGEILSYQHEPLDDLPIDCVIVDGPPFYTLRGREACLYQTYSKIRVGGIVFLDDCYRESERIVVGNWLSVFPGSFRLEMIPVGHTLAVLRKVTSVEPRWNDPLKSRDSSFVSREYQEFKSAMLHMDEDAWRQAWGENVVHMRHLLDAIYEAYGVAPEQVRAAALSDSQLGLFGRWLLRRRSFKTLRRLLNPK
jgi:hypothetical protein